MDYENYDKYYKKKIRAEILTPSVEEFHGTVDQLLRLVAERSMIYGSCGYRLLLEPRILLEVK